MFNFIKVRLIYLFKQKSNSLQENKNAICVVKYTFHIP